MRARCSSTISRSVSARCIARQTAIGRWWLLWLRVRRDDTGDPIDVAVPVNPGGEYIAEGPGGKTWGLQRSDSGTWQVSPSINVLADQVHPGPHDAPSMWHQTPRIVDVPDDAPWISGAP